MQSPPVSLGPNAEVRDIQPQVQRKLGRVMIRIQQYERLLKALLIESEVEGTVESAVAHREKRAERFKSKTLGTLVGEVTGSLMRPDQPTADAEPPGDLPSFRIRFGLQFEEERATQVEKNLGELVSLRNGLVHHLIDQFDVFSITGCEAALTHLDQSYETVDAAYAQLRAWAQSSMAAREALAEFMRSQQSSDLLLTDGSITLELPDANT